jgi:DNA mismatch repair protein MSH5
MELFAVHQSILIVDREIEIIHEVQQKIIKNFEMFLSVNDLLAELDCLLSLANAAVIFNYTRPNMTEAPVLNIENGRHPIYEQHLSPFIGNDCILEENEMKKPMILLTGANFSGKSVFLKQTGLIVYMAHLGSFVPADSATIGITDKILTRIQTMESVSKEVSSFMIDLNQINSSINLLTEHSLLLFDEFGTFHDLIKEREQVPIME